MMNQKENNYSPLIISYLHKKFLLPYNLDSVNIDNKIKKLDRIREVKRINLLINDIDSLIRQFNEKYGQDL